MYLFNNHKLIKQEIEKSLTNYSGRLYIFLLTLMIVVVQSGCRKFVEIDTPPDKITQANVFSNDRTANTVLTGIYSSMSGSNVGNADMAKYSGLLSDELSLWSGGDVNHQSYYTNSLISGATISTGKEIWNNYYNLIFTCNGAIEGIAESKTLTQQVKKQLSGEAYFMRAWFYFYLVNLYGDLPLATGTDPAVNSRLARSPTQAVYQLVIEDLMKAQELLSSNYVNEQLIPYPSGAQERVRPTVWAASSLLARVYLYTGDYAKAETETSKVINNSALFGLLPLKDIFLKNSREAIWQIQPTALGWNTEEARVFDLSAMPQGFSGSKPVYLSNFLLSAFEANDQRRNQWVSSIISAGVTYYFPIKYKIGSQNSAVNSVQMLTEYSMALRLSEQYLIRAEARAKQNKLTDAISDLDMIRNRAGLSLIANTNPGIPQTGLLASILHERQIELFTEWGDRWFELKRTGEIDALMQVVSAVKGGNWESTDQLLPIPYADLLYNHNLTQNAGY